MTTESQPRHRGSSSIFTAGTSVEVEPETLMKATE
jgi:hypothetical protein